MSSWGQEAAAAFAPEVELLDDVVEDEVEDVVLVVVVEDDELSEDEVLSAFFVVESPAVPDFSALTLPERESLR
ncbi:hypothetical protein [Actinoplanes sp. HUAS TT8]|uniref:hypothetical protein n=1 Tax=Actinoplanes sp. HUAS TT8 TaxID=3447453 RepID=UPI003F51D42A